MHFDPNGQAWVVESKADFSGWEILYTEDWKPGVKKVFMRKNLYDGCVSFEWYFQTTSILKELTTQNRFFVL